MSHIFKIIDEKSRNHKHFNVFTLDEITAILDNKSDVLKNKVEENDNYLIRAVMNNEMDLRQSFESKVTDYCFSRNSGYEVTPENSIQSDLINTFNITFTALRGFARFFQPLSENANHLFQVTVQELFSTAERLNIDRDRLSLHLYSEICHFPYQKDLLTTYIRDNFVKSDTFFRTRATASVGMNSFSIDNAFYIAAYNNELAGLEQFYQKEYVDKKPLEWNFNFTKNEFTEKVLDSDNQLLNAEVAVLLALAAEHKPYSFSKKECNNTFALFKKMGFDFTEEKEAMLILNAFNGNAARLDAFVDLNWKACDNKPLIKLIEENKYRRHHHTIISVFKEKLPQITDYLDSVSQDTYTHHLSKMVSATLENNFLAEDILDLLNNRFYNKNKERITDNRVAISYFLDSLLEPFVLISKNTPEKWQYFVDVFNDIMATTLTNKIEKLSESMLKSIRDASLDTRVKNEKNIIDVSLIFKENIGNVLLKIKIPVVDQLKVKRI